MKPLHYVLAVFLAVTAVFFFVRAGIKSDKKFEVVKFEEVKPAVGPDGRAAVGSPEVYQVRISPALAWQKADGSARLWIVIGFVVLAFTAIYIGLAGAEVLPSKPNIHYAFVGLAITLACWLAAYSSRFVSNYVELGKDAYEQVKDNPAALEKLFDKKLLK